MDELEPDYDDPSKCPKTLTRSRHINGVQYVAGRPPSEEDVTSDVMLVTVSVDEEEATTMKQSLFGYTMSQSAEYLRGATGVIKDVALAAGLDIDKCYYTAICKWLLPRMKRTKPPTKALRWGMPVLMDEIRRVKPKIIVCLGKQVFDMLSDTKIGFDDAHGGWFWSTEANAHLYVMHAPSTLIGKPDLYEMFRVDFSEVSRKRRILEGGDIDDLPVRFSVLRNEQDLRDWVGMLEDLDPWPGQLDDDGNKILSVDCEWHGRTHVDGNLRSIQFAWTESDAAVVEFRNEQNEWSFELDSEPEDDFPEVYEKNRYAVVGRILQKFMNKPDVRFMGHHYAADAPWMKTWLGLEIYRRCVMDTEFAQQTVDEASELGLERGIAMKYTTLGMYNQELIMWKRENKKLCENGYGYIPSAILHPYGAKDVIAPLRAYPFIKRQLEAQRLWGYYKTIHNPFVTDVFTEFCMTGLPMDMPLMDDLRVLFHFVRGQLEIKLKQRIHREAKSHVVRLLSELEGMSTIQSLNVTAKILKQPDAHSAMELLKPVVGMENIPRWMKIIQHLYDAPDFNIRSPDQMRNWLFEVEGLEPIKTTNQKAKGLPSMAWEKVLELPPERRRLYTPAVDKQTLQILSEACATLNQLLDLNAVGNVCKAFLKEADVWIDPDTGEEEVEEHGLHQWVASDVRIHGQTSCTGTSRPRSWAPNVLNIPKYVNERISRSVHGVIHECFEEGTLPEELLKWVDVPSGKLPSLRSCIKAPDGWVFVESDYKTAEMVALSKISGDVDLQRILEEPDPEWAALKSGGCVRVRFSSAEENGIPVSNQDNKYLMSVWKSGKKVKDVTDDDLARDAQGNVIHIGYDIHWSIAERIYELPREAMDKDIQRSAGKVINFSSAYGASPASLERKIESDTGVKPEPGTGQKGLDAIKARQPRATEFLEEMGNIPKTKGFYRAASGRVCHCNTHSAGSGVGWRTRNSIESALGRELKNYPMQESVASTSGRACKWLLHTCRELGLKSRPITCLYDSIVTLCPLEERFLVKRLHDVFMSEMNSWHYNDEFGSRDLQYGVDTEFNYRWSTPSSKEELKLLDDPTWHPTPEHLRWAERCKNWRLLVS